MNPVIGHLANFLQCFELVKVEYVFTIGPIESFNVAILIRTAGFYEINFNTFFERPVCKCA